MATRHPLRDCANLCTDVYAKASEAGQHDMNAKDAAAPVSSGLVDAASPDGSRQTLREIQEACTAMVQREAENTVMLLEGAARVRIAALPECIGSSHSSCLLETLTTKHHNLHLTYSVVSVLCSPGTRPCFGCTHVLNSAVCHKVPINWAYSCSCSNNSPWGSISCLV